MGGTAMKKTLIVWGLVWLNVALLVGLALKLTSSSARAQVARPSDYVMIPGVITQGVAAVVYIIDASQGRLAAVSYDDGGNTLSTMPWIDLSSQFQGAAVTPNRGY